MWNELFNSLWISFVFKQVIVLLFCTWLLLLGDQDTKTECFWKRWPHKTVVPNMIPSVLNHPKKIHDVSFPDFYQEKWKLTISTVTSRNLVVLFSILCEIQVKTCQELLCTERVFVWSTIQFSVSHQTLKLNLPSGSLKVNVINLLATMNMNITQKHAASSSHWWCMLSDMSHIKLLLPVWKRKDWHINYFCSSLEKYFP